MHKFYRNTATPIHWCITTFSLWGWSWVVVTEQVAKLNYLLSGPWQKRFADPSSRLYTHTLSLFHFWTMCSRLSTKISSFHADPSMMQSWVINITLTLPDDTAVSPCANCVILHNLRDDAVANTASGHILASRQVDLSALSSSVCPVTLALCWVSRCVETATVLTALAWGLSG